MWIWFESDCRISKTFHFCMFTVYLNHHLIFHACIFKLFISSTLMLKQANTFCEFILFMTDSNDTFVKYLCTS